MRAPARTPLVKLIFDRYHKASNKQKGVVEIRISFEKKQKYISTAVYLYPKQWHDGTVINCVDANQLNQLINKMLIDVRQAILDMENEGSIDIFDIPRRIAALKMSNSFVEYVAEQAERRKHNKIKATQKRYDYFIQFLIKWGKIERFNEVNEKNILELDNYLKEKNLKDTSAWANYHRFLNSFIRDAIRDGYLKRNPYDYVTISRRKLSDQERHLTPDEFRTICDVELPTEVLCRERDMFVLQTYLCTSHSDLYAFSLKPDTYLKTIKGKTMFAGKRKKTGKDFCVLVIPQAQEILEKYNYKLPVPLNPQKRNDHLKLIAQAAGLDYPLSTHWARHTGGTLYLNKGVPVTTVAKMLGDTIEMTEKVYAKYLDTTVADEVSKIENLDKL